jgi:phage terminase small subunit
MQEITNRKHKTFADEFILTGEAVASYQKAYPKSKHESARVESYKILQNPTIANYIKTKQLEIQNARQNNVLNELKSKDSRNILEREKIVEMQSNVSKIAYNQFLKSKDKQDGEFFIKSVESLNKLEGYHKATKTESVVLISPQPIFGNSSLDE